MAHPRRWTAGRKQDCRKWTDVAGNNYVDALKRSSGRVAAVAERHSAGTLERAQVEADRARESSAPAGTGGPNGG